MEQNPKSNPGVTNEQPKKTKKHDKRRIMNNIIVVFLCLVLLGSVTGFFMLSKIIGKVSDIDRELVDKVVNTEPSTVYAADGTEVGESGAESRQLITYDQLPQVTIDAFLAIEDSRYFKHNGFDLPRFVSSALTNLKSGSFAQGGSTLTMQTIDNFFIKQQEEADKKKGITYSKLDQIEHKIQEIYLSMRLDSKMSKEEILINYLNKINFGSAARGIQKGSEYYFGKDVEDLNLSESAFLAGVINAPNNYNAYQGYNKNGKNKTNFYKLAMDRRNETLGQMLNHGYITKTEYELAKSTELAFQLNGETTNKDNQYSDYIQAAVKEAAALTGEDPSTTPMKIYTALDKTAQKNMNKVMSKEVITIPDNKYFQIASVVINNADGTVVSVGQGFNEAQSTYLARATTPNNMQLGSTAKPFLEYALAFENCGWATSRVIDDKYLDINGHVIVNYDNKYHGKVTLERAIAQSLNSPAVQTMQTAIEKMGNDDIIKYLKSLGFNDSVAEAFDYQYAIGAAAFVASPLQVAAAFSTLANNGTYIEPHFVTKVEYKDGSKTVENNPKKTQALSPQAAYMVNDLLNKAVTGKYSSYNFMSSAFSGVNYPVYGKTGTSDWGDFSAEVGGTRRDGWMVNYTSQYTIASWNGFDTRVNGYTYISSDVQNMNIPGKINRYILDSITTNAKRIENPGGLSSYGGGLIKTEYLSSAAKNNPETETNMTQVKDKLTKSVASAERYDSTKYTPETWAAFQRALAEAKTILGKDNPTDDEIQKAMQALEAAMKGLKEQTKVTIDTSKLTNSITTAQAYMDTSKYKAQYVKALVDAINNGSYVLSNASSTQAQIDAATNAINIAITNCKNNPITTTPDPDVPANPDDPTDDSNQ